MTAISALWLTPASNRVVQKPTLPLLSSGPFSPSSGEMKDTPAHDKKHCQLRVTHLTEISLVSCLFGVSRQHTVHYLSYFLTRNYPYSNAKTISIAKILHWIFKLAKSLYRDQPRKCNAHINSIHGWADCFIEGKCLVQGIGKFEVMLKPVSC